MAISATLNGYPMLGSSDVRWVIQEGVKPYEAEFDMMPHHADALLAAKQMTPVTLVLDDDFGRNVRIQGLYVISRAVGPNPHIDRVLVVDRRWFWDHAHVERHINVRREGAPKRQKAPDTPPETTPTAPTILYAPFSLNNDQPWTAREVLESVLTQCIKVESTATGYSPEWEIDPSLGSRLDNLPIENLELADPGDMALSRVLAYLPEGAVKLTKGGKVIVYSRATGEEEQAVYGAGAESVRGGHVDWISKARLRPKAIHVLFTREHEVRFDWTESDQETFSPDERYMQNVLPVPDYQLTLQAPTPGQAPRDVAQGTWISFVDAFNAWGAPPNQEYLSSAGQWFTAVRRWMVPFLDGWTGIQLNGDEDPDADWMGRIGAIQQHYRRTFRINPRWMARILRLKAEKVATLDTATGTRAPALVYADHARMASQRSIRQAFSGGTVVPVVMNVASYPTSGNLDSTGRAAPAELSIADHDQGIVHVTFLADIYRNHEQILPSKVDNPPVIDINDPNSPISFNSKSSRWEGIPTLTGSHKVAVVMTAIPAGNNSQLAPQLQRVTKTPQDVADSLPPSLARNIQQSFGPEMEIRINPTIETARVAWVDARSADIEAAMGVTGAGFNIDDLVTNLVADARGAASLDAIATAVAARTYAMLADRVMGEKTVRLQPTAEPLGWVEGVTHSIAAETGAAETTIALPDKLPQIDFFSLLPQSTRRVVLRMAPTPGKAAG